jgi:hypothetical protein
VLPAPTTTWVRIWAWSPVRRPKLNQHRLSATLSQVLVGDRPRVRPCRHESQTWGQMTAMLKAAARRPKTAIMVERRSVQWTAVGAVTGRVRNRTGPDAPH